VIAVTLGGEDTSGKPPQPSSSFIVDVLPGEVNRQHSLVQNHLAPGTAGTDDTFTIEVRDAYANLNASAGAALISMIVPATENSLRVADNSNGTWIISYRVTVSGQYEIGCNVGSVQFQPAYFSILPGPVSATSTVSEGNDSAKHLPENRLSPNSIGSVWSVALSYKSWNRQYQQIFSSSS